MTLFNNIWSKGTIYGRLCVLQLLFLIVILFSSEPTFLFGNNEDASKLSGLFASVINLIYFFYALMLLNVLEKPKIIRQLIWGYYGIALISLFTVINPYVNLIPEDEKPLVFSIYHVVNIAVDLYLCYAILMDIFKSQETQSDHIWGAVSVYFTLIMIFAGIYEVITLNNVGFLGDKYQAGFPNYIQCIVFSLSSTAGSESVFPNAYPILKKLGSLQNVLGNLYLIIILGQLLSHPIRNMTNK